jgi:DNA-binding MurR/RpiR family transcriptional regulator
VSSPKGAIAISTCDRGHIFPIGIAGRINAIRRVSYMTRIPESVEQFLQAKRIAVAGVSRHADVAANAVFKKLRDCGYEVFPVNPNAQTLAN